MSKDQQTEIVEKEVEIMPQPQRLELNQSKFDAMIRFADQADKIGRTLDTIRKFVLSRALPGDWVQHGNNINLSGPGAERVLSALGLMNIEASFTNWKYWKDTGTDKNGDWFVWWYEADVQIGGLRYEKVQGRAGSRDQFFGYAHGAWKDLSEVKETDIRMAARRGVIKDGIKLALGLRSIPVESAEALGIDKNKIKAVEYGSSKAGTQTSGAQDEFVAVVVDVTIKRQKPAGEDGKGGYTIYAIKFNNNVTAETLDKTVAEKAKALKTKKVFARTAAAKDPKYAPSLVEIRTATPEDEKQPEFPAEDAGDAQEPA